MNAGRCVPARLRFVQDLRFASSNPAGATLLSRRHVAEGFHCIPMQGLHQQLALDRAQCSGGTARALSYAALVFRRYSQRSEIVHVGHAGARALHT